MCVFIDTKTDRHTHTKTHTYTTKSSLAASLRNRMPAPRTAAYTARRICRGEKLAVCMRVWNMRMYVSSVCDMRMHVS